METSGTGRQRQRQKSPNAPAYSVQECLEDARRIFRVENQVPISRESIAEHLNLAAQSGPFNRKLSSLRQYGLLEPIGKDLRISDLFLRVDHAADEGDRRRSIREALGRPTIFQGLLGQYENTGMPSDVNLINQLIMKYRFTRKNAETVAKAFLESYRFAGLGQGRLFPFPPPPPPSLASQELPALPAPDRAPPRYLEERQPHSQCRQEIPLGIGRRAIIELPEDISPEEIAKIVRVLQALSDTER